MDAAGLLESIDAMRRIGGEALDVELKAGSGGYPKSIAESIVSFANTRGGTILIGIDEYDDFSVIGVEQAAEYRTAVVGQASDAVEPPVDVGVEIVEIADRNVLVVDVPEAAPSAKPVYLKSKGIANGALIRTRSDGDRRMTAAELGLLYAARSQPEDDRRPQMRCSLADLSRPRLLRTFERVRAASPALRDVSEDVLLLRLGIASQTPDGQLVPTLAGLLTFCDFPQEFHPQLMVSFIALPGSDSSERFTDNVSVRGSIPSMVAETVAAVQRNLSVRSTVDADGRAERFDYSMEAVREAVANALLHRDYSEITRGTQVQVELHPDTLIVKSPGGLYGPVSEDSLGQEGLSSSRNTVLASLLSDAFLPASDRLVVENRASGVPTMIREARRQGQPRPRFESSVTNFTVALSRSALLDDGVRRWIEVLHLDGLTSEHEVALAMLRVGSVTNEVLREWGMDRITAGSVLRDLVSRGIALKEGGRRYARYVLSPEARPEVVGSAARPAPSPASSDQIARHLSQSEWVSAKRLEELSGFGRSWVVERLRELVQQGVVETRGAGTSPSRAYRLRRDDDAS